jgi:hypothetical protein
MALTDEQRAALLAEIRDDPLGLGLRTGGHARTAKALDYHVWNVLRGASDGQERLAAIGCAPKPAVLDEAGEVVTPAVECESATLADVSTILDELES